MSSSILQTTSVTNNFIPCVIRHTGTNPTDAQSSGKVVPNLSSFIRASSSNEGLSLKYRIGVCVILAIGIIWCIHEIATKIFGSRNSLDLIRACEQDNVDDVRKMLKDGACPNSWTHNNSAYEYESIGLYKSAIGYAIAKQNKQIVELLLEHGLNVKSQPIGETVLFSAVVSSRDELGFETVEYYPEKDTAYEIIELLLNKGAVCDERIAGGSTPFCEAIRRKRYDIAELLLDKGADPNLADKNGKNALFWAAGHRGQVEMVKGLLKHKKASPSTYPKEQENPIIQAAKTGSGDIIEALHSEKYDVDVYDKDGGTPLIWATYYNNTDAAIALLALGANPALSPNQSFLYQLLKPATVLAAQKGNNEVLTLLINRDRQILQMHGKEALLKACQNGYVDSVNTLLANGVSPEKDGSKCPLNDTLLLLKYNQAYKAAAAYESIVDLLLQHDDTKPTIEDLLIICLVEDHKNLLEKCIAKLNLSQDEIWGKIRIMAINGILGFSCDPPAKSIDESKRAEYLAISKGATNEIVRSLIAENNYPNRSELEKYLEDSQGRFTKGA